jgi:Recombinase
MPRTERLRETPGSLTLELLVERAQQGWRLAAVEWVRLVEGEETLPQREQPAYGLRVAADGQSLEQDPDEQRAIVAILGMVIQDKGCVEIARVLNERGFRTRQLEAWTPTEIFQLMPRLIEAGQKTLATPEWAALRPSLLKGPSA